MGREQSGGSVMEEIGALIVHAEAAQAALDKGLATQAENTETIKKLIQYAAVMLKKLQAEAEQIGPRAEQAGAVAVREQVRESLSGAGAIVDGAARAALVPVMTDTATRIDEARRAATILDRQAARLSNRMLAILAASAIGPLALIGFTVWAALAWQRSELASLSEQKTELQGEIATMTETARKMRAEGLKIEFGNCAEAKGRQRLCVAAQPGVPRWGTEQTPFYVLKGY